MRRLRLPGALLALLLMGAGCAASRAARPVSEQDREGYEARLRKAQALQRGAHQDASREELESLAREVGERLGKHPRDVGLHAVLARTALALRQPDRARVETERVLALAPDQAEAHYLQAFLLGGARQPAAALAEARSATRLDPHQGRYWQLLGTLHLQLEQPTEARAALSRALEVEPHDAQGHFLLALLSLDEGKPDEALTALERARELEPDFVLAHTQAGQLLQQRGESTAALACFQKAATLEPRNWRTRESLVQVHQALGNTARRDAEREALLELRQEGLVDQDYFIRERWREGEHTVVVVEDFELKGDWAKRYEFQVYAPGGKQPVRVISLGSYAFTNAFAHEQDPSLPRLFHLDAYAPDDTHETYGLFQGEPSYDDTRAKVLAILRGELEPTSSTKPGAG
ncbi:tetratricopeptide repeat protein [Cystobacter fuscus]|nr:tetratricopeptide repeat protein [Cystobacter fuscus]